MKKTLKLKINRNIREAVEEEAKKAQSKYADVDEIPLEDIIADNNKRFLEAVAAYKRLASVDTYEDLLEENLFDNPLNRVASEYAIGRDKLIELLKEEASKVMDASKASEEEIAAAIEKTEDEATENQAEKAAEVIKQVDKGTKSDLDIVYVEGDLERSLNASLSVGKRAHNKWVKNGDIDKNGYSNICVVGDVGVGKTERVKAWCRAKGLRLVSFKADSLTIDDIKAIPIGEDPDRPGRAKTVSFGTFDIFDKDDLCVLYLDEYNRAPAYKRAAWFKFIDEHMIYDPTNKETGMKFFPNLLFTVVTINPYIYEDGTTDDEEGVTPLSKAEKNRFASYKTLSTQDANFNKYQLDYYKKYYTNDTRKYPEYADENAGRLSIATSLLENPNFFFNSTRKIKDLHDQDSQFLTPRSLTLLLTRCDGTVKNFLELAPDAIGEENTKVLKTFLKSYKDINDKPNEVWSFWDKFNVKLPKPEAEEEQAAEEEQGTLKKRVSMLDKIEAAKKALSNKDL